jgi:hypothetical protein
MARATARTNSRRSNTAAIEKATEELQEFKSDAIEYLTEYARQNPGYAALWCLGIGFVLGWKLKFW